MSRPSWWPDRSPDRRWFAPKRLGIGVRPQGWGGWLATAAVVALALTTATVPTLASVRLPVLIGLLAGYGVLVALTFGPDRPDRGH